MKCFEILLSLLILLSNSVEQEINLNKENKKNIELSAICYSLDNAGESFNHYTNYFNEYSKKNDLNIIIKLNFISSTNSTLSFNNMGIMMEDLLSKKSSKYDIVFYDNSLTSLYGPYLINLSKWLPKEHIDMYNKEILSLTGYYDNYLVGLVIFNENLHKKINFFLFLFLI